MRFPATSPNRRVMPALAYARPGDSLVDAFTGEAHLARAHHGGAALEVDALLGVLPVSLLVRAG